MKSFYYFKQPTNLIYWKSNLKFNEGSHSNVDTCLILMPPDQISSLHKSRNVLQNTWLTVASYKLNKEICCLELTAEKKESCLLNLALPSLLKIFSCWPAISGRYEIKDCKNCINNFTNTYIFRKLLTVWIHFPHWPCLRFE